MYLTEDIDIAEKRVPPAGGISFRVLLTVFILYLFAGNNFLHAQLISISARFDTTTIWIGEQTRFTITVEQPPDMVVNQPVLSDTLSENIEILSVLPADTTLTGDNRYRITRAYVITSFNPGKHYVKPMPFIFFIDGEEREIFSRQLMLEVLAPEIDEEAGIYDIKGPFGIPLGVMEILPWVLLIIIVLLLVWYSIKYIKKRKNREPLFKAPVQSDPPHVTALRELNRLKSASLWQQGRTKEYHTRLTEILRIYIEERFGVKAMEQTSDEIIRDLRQKKEPDDKLVKSLDNIFSVADLVKFAKASPRGRENEKSLDSAFHFVNETCNSFPGQDNKEKDDDPAVAGVKKDTGNKSMAHGTGKH